MFIIIGNSTRTLSAGPDTCLRFRRCLALPFELWLILILPCMPSLAVTRADNAQYAPKSRPVVVVFGGTSGYALLHQLSHPKLKAGFSIGEGIVRAFARNTHGNVHIVILGRSKSSADAIIASLPQNENGLYEFVAMDAVLMRNVVTVCTELKTNANGKLQAPLVKINYLILSQGAALFGAPDTEDGLRPILALGLYGRTRAILELVDLLERAAELGEDGRAMTIGAAGNGGPLDLSDVGMKNLSFLRFRGAFVTTVDISILVRS